MIRTFLIDDERPALNELEYFLAQYPEICIEDTFLNPQEAIEKAKAAQPHLVFLDINMPQVRGIEVASQLAEACKDLEIVFVTAYEQFAIDAFELNALDYIVKPIKKDRLDKTIQRILKRKNRVHNSDKKLLIRCLGRFQMGWEGEPPVKWRTEKTRELFAFLVHNRGRELSKFEILDILWMDEDPEKAFRQLYNGIYYIRKTLQEYSIEKSQILIGNNYCLTLGPIFLDIRDIAERIINDQNPSFESLKKLETHYTGDYFEGEDWPWVELERENMARLFEEHIMRLASSYRDNHEFIKAEEVLKKAYTKNPYNETITENLISLYLQTGDRSKAARHYMGFSNLLWQDLRLKPHEKLQKLYEKVK